MHHNTFQTNYLSRATNAFIYGTKVDDGVLETLTKLPKLKKVFLYDTEVSSRVAFRFLTKNPELDLNLGWDFESLKKLGDFVVDLKWDFNSWLPLVSRILPSDICKISKKGINIYINVYNIWV